MFATKTYVRGLMIAAVLLIGASQGRDSRCKRPFTESHCNVSEKYIHGWKSTGWFFEPVLKVCLPFFTPDGWHVCPQNYDLPIKRENCEEFCGETCTMINGSTGVCMHRDICRPDFYQFFYSRTGRHRDTCDNSLLYCCPRISDERLNKYNDPTKDPDGIIRSTLRKSFGPSEHQRVMYVYNIPMFPYLDGRFYK